MPTNAEILTYAPGAAYLAANDIRNSGLFNNSGRTNPILPQQIYAIYFILKKIYDLDPNYSGMTARCLYLWEMCGKYGVKSIGISGGGGSVTPIPPITPGTTIPSPILVRGSNFTTATSWQGANAAGVNVLATYTIQVYWNDVQRYLDEDHEWTRTSTGFDIIINGTTITEFDALVNNYRFYIDISV